MELPQDFQEIAVAVNVRVRTIKGHRRMMFAKMNVPSTTQLVRTALGKREAIHARSLRASHAYPPARS